MSVEQNKANIQQNRRRIFELENQVLYNQSLAYATRSLVNENAALINKNYQAAFIGNRQLANQNTDDLFRNRLTIVRNIPATTPVQENYREALTNRTKLEFLDHRSKLNERVLGITERLSNVNRTLIDVNRSILDSNEEIVQFNAKLIANNTKLLQEGVNATQATPESNGELIAANRAAIDGISRRAQGNGDRIQRLYEATHSNRASILANNNSIQDRRERILENHNKIAQNQRRVAEFISKL
jgi:hypothetical protein